MAKIVHDSAHIPHANLAAEKPGRRGPKPLYADAPMVLIAMRVTHEQREKLRRLGGASWMRQRIDSAQDPG